MLLQPGEGWADPESHERLRVPVDEPTRVFKDPGDRLDDQRQGVRLDLRGLPYKAARALAVKAGWNPRRLTPDMVISAEFQAGRLNFLVDKGDVVLDASLG
jgi:hypothetical protein